MKRKRPMPAALKAYWDKRRGKRANSRRRRGVKPRRRSARSGKTVVTTVSSRTIRKTNPRMSVLYAVKGRSRLKYLGGIKFGAKGRPKFFSSSAQARAAAKLLRTCFPGPLRGFTLSVDGA